MLDYQSKNNLLLNLKLLTVLAIWRPTKEIKIKCKGHHTCGNLLPATKQYAAKNRTYFNMLLSRSKILLDSNKLPMYSLTSTNAKTCISNILHQRHFIMTSHILLSVLPLVTNSCNQYL